jgi:rare lipoprotein A
MAISTPPVTLDAVQPTARFVVRSLVCVITAGFLAGCAQSPKSQGRSKEFFPSSVYGRASERVVGEGEPVPRGGGQYLVGRPYTIAGKRYVPNPQPKEAQVGMASYYGGAFHGRRTANGEVYDMNSVTAAHPTMPLPSYARVTNVRNGRSIIVRVNDRGPYHSGRVMDVSSKVAEALAFKSLGTAQIKVEYVGKAGLQGSDDNKLLASLRTDGRPAQLDGSPSLSPTMVAQNAPVPVQPAPQRVAMVEEPREQPAPAAAITSQSVVALPARIAAMPTSAPLPPSRPFDLGLPASSGGQGLAARPRQAALFDSSSQSAPASPLLALRKDPIAEVLMLPPRRPQ